MLAISLLSLGTILGVILLLRGWQTGNLTKFPFFYAYIFSAFLASIIADFLLLTYPKAYRPFYWPAQFATLFLGCGIVLEIFGHVLSVYPGARRFARAVCGIVFCAIFSVELLYPHGRIPAVARIELERNVRTAQIIFFVAIVSVILHYRIPLAGAIRGMLHGYGLYLGTSLVTLALRYYDGANGGGRWDDVWRFIQPTSFDVSLLIWTVALWRYSPNSAASGTTPDADYQSFAASTRKTLGAAWSHLGRSVR